MLAISEYVFRYGADVVWMDAVNEEMSVPLFSGNASASNGHPRIECKVLREGRKEIREAKVLLIG